MSAAGAPFLVPPLPEFERRKSVTMPTSGKDTKTETLSDEQSAALGGQDAVLQEQIKATEKARQLKEAEARAEAAGARDQQLAGEWVEQQRRGPQAQAASDYITWARNHTRSEEEKLRARPAPALFADSEGWDKVRKNISLALAGLGDGMIAAAHIRTGMAAPKGTSVDAIIDQDIERQKAAIEKLKDNVVIARTGLKDAEEARRALLADIDLRGAAMAKNAELLMRSRLAGLKLDQAAVDQTKEILDLKSKQAQYRADYVKGHSTTVNKRWDSAKTTTEEVNRVPTAGTEGKVPAQQAALAKQTLAEVEKLRAAEPLSEKALQSLQDNSLKATAADESISGAKPMAGTVALIGRGLDAIPRNRYEGLSEKERQTAQTVDAMKQYLIHMMTGAGASAKEASEKAEAFGWVPGDTPKTMSAKLDRAEQLARQYVPAAPGAAGGGSPAAAGAPAARPASDGKPSAKQIAAAKAALEKGSGADEEDKQRARDVLLRARKR